VTAKVLEAIQEAMPEVRVPIREASQATEAVRMPINSAADAADEPAQKSEVAAAAE